MRPIPTPARALAGDDVARRFNVRLVFYIAYYLLNFAFAADFPAALLTIPMFVAILLSLRATDPRQVGVLDILVLVYFLFFCIVPLQQVDHGIFVNGELLKNFEYPLGDFVLVHLLALISFAFLYFGLAKSSVGPAPIFRPRGIARPVLLAVIVASIAANIWVQGGIVNVLAPRYLKEELVLGQIAPLFLGLQSVGTLVYFASGRDARSPWDYLPRVLLVLLLAVMANPFNVARFALIGVWAPLLIYWVPFVLRPLIFYVSSVFILLVAVPLLSISSRSGLFTSTEAYEGLSAGSFLTLKNLNVLELTLEAVAYVRKSGSLSGDIFISTVFTHVPRAWWPAKPLASNLEVGRNLVSFYRYSNDNLAVPWFMDGYMDFGVVGSIGYAALAALVLWWLNRSVRYYVGGIDPLGLCLLANFLILARGTLAVVFSLFLFQVVTAIVIRRTLLVRASAPVPRRRPEPDRVDRRLARA